jgi:hypothetical protein
MGRRCDRRGAPAVGSESRQAGGREATGWRDWAHAAGCPRLTASAAARRRVSRAQTRHMFTRGARWGSC